MMAEVHTIKNIISETHHSELLSEGPAVAAAAVVTVSLVWSVLNSASLACVFLHTT